MISVLANDKPIKYVELHLEKSLDNLCASFDLILRQRLQLGSSIKILIHEQVFLDGYVDAFSVSLDKYGTRYVAYGRDRTADLVDSCIELKEFKEKPVEDVVKSAVAKYDTKVEVERNDKISIKPTPGDTIFECLNTALSKKELSLFTRRGVLHVESSKFKGSPQFFFEEGRNILSIEHTENQSKRFHKYTVIKDNDTFESKKIVINLIDPEINRPRLHLILDDEPAAEAKFQLENRKAKSNTISLETYDYKQNNRVFDVGMKANVVSPTLGLKGDFLIHSISIDLNSDNRKTTKLTLSSPEPLKKITTKKDTKSSWDFMRR